MKKKPVVVLTGPTGAGKTKLSIELAKRIGASIISADSVQVYKGLDIGSDKISPKDMDEIDHYLVDILDPLEKFDVTLFKELAEEAFSKIWKEGRIPLLVGGTAFYIRAVVYDTEFEKESGGGIYRKELEERLKNGEDLYEELKRSDQRSAEKIHPNNTKRIIRALEFYHENGYPISEHNEAQRKKKSPYNLAYFVLNDDRQRLYEKINDRAQKMIERGLEDEVRGLLEKGIPKDSHCFNSIGYSEMVKYMEGGLSMEETLRTIKQNTRHFAKRQLTWFRKEEDAVFINKNELNFDDEKILGTMMDMLIKKGIV